MPVDVPLVLGGHSFIQQLGNEPTPSSEDQELIVAACLDAGVNWFDTTYQPERVALGRALERLGRRSEATIIAWNFFRPFGPGDDVGGASAYQPQHLRQMQDELRTRRIDRLVVHGVGDRAEDRRQLELAFQWQADGAVGELGVWAPGPDVEKTSQGTPYRFMVLPMNLTTPESRATFLACKRMGWATLATSPFVRGWELDKLLARAGGTIDRATLADLMLRFSLFAPGVDRLIVAMRRVEWVARNVASARRGPLDPEQRRSLVGVGR
jgi:aryl-alcohol dehydrogenase-like predicted oxidoreductase